MRYREGERCALPPEAFAEIMKEVLERGKSFRFRARGTSMTPFIRDGDTLTIAPLSRRRPRPGDVVAFFESVETIPLLVVHRIVKIRETGLVIRGDAVGREPEVVPSEALVGRVVRVERDGRVIRAGLGPERLLIARLNRTGLPWTVIRTLGKLFRSAFGMEALGS